MLEILKSTDTKPRFQMTPQKYLVLVYLKRQTKVGHLVDCYEHAKEYAKNIGLEGVWTHETIDGNHCEVFYPVNEIDKVKIIPVDPEKDMDWMRRRCNFGGPH